MAKRPTPNFDFENAPFYVNHNAKPWESTMAHRAVPASAPTASAAPISNCAWKSINRGYLDEIDAEERAPHSVFLPQCLHPPKTGARYFRLGASNSAELKAKLETAIDRLEGGWTPPVELPGPGRNATIRTTLIDFGDPTNCSTAQPTLRRPASDTAAWKALQSQGIFRGSGAAPGKSPLCSPVRAANTSIWGELAAVSRRTVVQTVFDEADKVMTPILESHSPITSSSIRRTSRCKPG